MNNIKSAANKYASWGWKVFPLHGIDQSDQCTCSNPNCSNVGKHPATKRGFHDATDDPMALYELMAIAPDECNIGIKTGVDSGFFVLDIDGPEGEKYLQNKDVPETLIHKTGRGTHLFLSIQGQTLK